MGGTDDDLDVIRNCLQSRWPYPLSRDYKVMSGVSKLILQAQKYLHEKCQGSEDNDYDYEHTFT